MMKKLSHEKKDCLRRTNIINGTYLQRTIIPFWANLWILTWIFAIMSNRAIFHRSSCNAFTSWAINSLQDISISSFFHLCLQITTQGSFSWVDNVALENTTYVALWARWSATYGWITLLLFITLVVFCCWLFF